MLIFKLFLVTAVWERWKLAPACVVCSVPNCPCSVPRSQLPLGKHIRNSLWNSTAAVAPRRLGFNPAQQESLLSYWCSRVAPAWGRTTRAAEGRKWRQRCTSTDLDEWWSVPLWLSTPLKWSGKDPELAARWRWEFGGEVFCRLAINLYVYYLLEKQAAHCKILVCLVLLLKNPVLLTSDEEETDRVIQERWYESFVVLRNG